MKSKISEKDYKSWVIKREYALKILNCALGIHETDEDFINGSKKIEALLDEFEQKIDRRGLNSKANLI